METLLYYCVKLFDRSSIIRDSIPLIFREDYLRAIRALLREIVRSLKYEINLVEFCRGLLQDRREQAFHELEQIYKVKTPLCIFLIIFHPACLTSLVICTLSLSILLLNKNKESHV